MISAPDRFYQPKYWAKQQFLNTDFPVGGGFRLVADQCVNEWKIDEQDVVRTAHTLGYRTSTHTNCGASRTLTIFQNDNAYADWANQFDTVKVDDLGPGAGHTFDGMVVNFPYPHPRIAEPGFLTHSRGIICMDGRYGRQIAAEPSFRNVANRDWALTAFVSNSAIYRVGSGNIQRALTEMATVWGVRQPTPRDLTANLVRTSYNVAFNLGVKPTNFINAEVVGYKDPKFEPTFYSPSILTRP